MENFYSKYFIYLKKYIFIIILLLFRINKRMKKIGVIGLVHGANIGNNLLKFAIFIKLSELGFQPYIIGVYNLKSDISFINQTTNLIIIKNFSEIKKNDYDILMVNSDQTWRKFRKNNKDFHDYAFLKFSKNWNISKFIYGASLGIDYWEFTKEDEIIAKECLKDFSGISVREIGSINLVYKHLGIKPIFVLDPTLLINKKYYLNIIRNYKSNIRKHSKYIFTYLFSKKYQIKNFINQASDNLKYEVFSVTVKTPNNIQKFIYGISHCSAVITQSFHGTLFSIIFNKPFITFINYSEIIQEGKKNLKGFIEFTSQLCKLFNDDKNNAIERFISLQKLLKLENRFFYYNEIPNISLLTTPLNIDYDLLNALKIKSINFLKKNLIKKNK